MVRFVLHRAMFFVLEFSVRFKDNKVNTLIIQIGAFTCRDTCAEVCRTRRKMTQKKRRSDRSDIGGYGDNGYVVLDARKMEEIRMQKGMSVRQFAMLAEVSGNTAARFFREEQIQWQVARRLFNSLGIEDFRPFLRSEGTNNTASDVTADRHLLGEWQISTPISAEQKLSNGLKFQLFKLEHTLLPNTFGRGKCFNLDELRTRDSNRVQEQLLRHPTVCRSVAPHLRFPVNERVLYNDSRDRFWVIDRWFDGITLIDKLRYGPIGMAKLLIIMTQILEGLDALHAKGIIRRELSPAYITLAEPDGHVLLTELELAKLLDGAISVSESWPEDPYRAPEIESAEIDATVDFFSWAQIFLHGLTGSTPAYPADPKSFRGTNLPAAVQAVGERCLSPSHRWRPKSAKEILKVLARVQP